ncbi:MAG: leucyl/phenylalanyl-tRNA--protein transferase [Erythrobacter sp.]|uniref:leucyl/phenylalanyl-tRNA--protein transferase n=1 Tax=Erythrobacter sp. TaxID=1042 RepID=UPI00261A89EA|nr:leucyl/phenylalanyl-tRNA--protein transferase [Erythrobacter sp.]MDJ0979039.1 leucyl/phenylalanyl-tRNA--protein transferase [Erythrobacter sp.]
MHSPLRSAIPVETLLLAYRSGIFPMADKREDPDIFWVEPRERAILPLHLFHLSKSLRKVVRADRFVVTLDGAFEEVVKACAEPRPGHPETWISDRILRSYVALHEAGHAHSIECWRASDQADGPPVLMGGLYGVCFERVFCGESMFSRTDNASKVALAWLVALMRRARYQLLDCQFMTDHLASLGAIEMPQRMYLQALERARGRPRMSLMEAYKAFTREAVAGSVPGVQLLPDDSPGKRIAQSLTQTS